MKKFRLFLFAIIATASLVFNSAGSAADCVTTIVTEDDIVRQPEGTLPTNEWVLYTRGATPPTAGQFVVGPTGAPLGVGSLRLQTANSSEKVWLFNYDHVGTALSDVNQIGYSTYRTAGNLQQVTALNIEVDINGGTLNPGEYTVLVFEPVYNLAQGPVVNNTWQTWDAYSGGNAIWWSSRPIPGVCAFSCYVTWDQIVAANPNATIVGGFGFNQGSGNPGLTTNVDALSIGTEGEDGSCITYNMDPYRVATTRDQCKNGGYNGVRRADGSTFKNQGDCVSYANNGK